MPSSVNKPKLSLRKTHRAALRISKKVHGTISKPIVNPPGIPINQHQRKSRNSNPTAPITLSKKKLKRTRKLAWIMQKASDPQGEAMICQ